MQQQHYFIVVLAHSLHGKLKRVHIPYTALYAVLVLALFGCFSLFGMVSSYIRMVWKISNYNELREEVQSLRSRYQTLEKSAEATNEQLATLQVFATEVSIAYGIKRSFEGPDDITEEGRLVPTLRESIDEYDFLKTATFQRRRNTTYQANGTPMLWPVAGRLLSHFGERTDPFSGEGDFHTGVDISAVTGTPVRASADGTVIFAGRSTGYGLLVVLDHPNGLRTYYAHLSRFSVIPGQDVRMGEVIALSGGTGRVTSPHLHYEVRAQGLPVNPYKFLQNTMFMQGPVASRDLPF